MLLLYFVTHTSRGVLRRPLLDRLYSQLYELVSGLNLIQSVSYEDSAWETLTGGERNTGLNKFISAEIC
jgi:hypothetical protein